MIVILMELSNEGAPENREIVRRCAVTRVKCLALSGESTSFRVAFGPSGTAA